MNCKKKMAVLALSISAMAAAPALAQNPNYAPGDLVLAFQNPGGTVGADKTVYVSLGDTATLFRGTQAGPSGASNLLGIINISQTLIAAFGANWAQEISLYAGLSGVWGTSPANSTLQNGDPHRTLYVSSPRQGLGILGQANSTAWTINTDTGMSTGAGVILNQNNILETKGTGAIYVSPVDESTIDNNNPIVAGSATGFNQVFPGGIQQQGTAGSLGNFGGVQNVEFALDLYRIAARNNITGQVDGPVREGTFEGTVVIDQSGNVSFLAVPEPSTAALLAASLGMAGFVRRRRRA